MTACLPDHYAHNRAVGREDRAMLRSNLSARADARAWAAMLVSLLILALHAWAENAINLLDLQIRISPTWETPWLPYVKISGVDLSYRSFSGGRVPRHPGYTYATPPGSAASRGGYFTSYRPGRTGRQSGSAMKRYPTHGSVTM
jgi:hypothetical protein